MNIDWNSTIWGLSFLLVGLIAVKFAPKDKDIRRSYTGVMQISSGYLLIITGLLLIYLSIIEPE